MKLELLETLCKGATPGPWKHDLGNCEIEGPRPDRYPICPIHYDHRKPGFEGQVPNPTDPMSDGELIVVLRNHAEALIQVARAATLAQARYRKDSGDWYDVDLDDALRELEDIT